MDDGSTSKFTPWWTGSLGLLFLHSSVCQRDYCNISGLQYPHLSLWPCHSQDWTLVFLFFFLPSPSHLMQLCQIWEEKSWRCPRAAVHVAWINEKKSHVWSGNLVSGAVFFFFFFSQPWKKEKRGYSQFSEWKSGTNCSSLSGTWAEMRRRRKSSRDLNIIIITFQRKSDLSAFLFLSYFSSPSEIWVRAGLSFVQTT